MTAVDDYLSAYVRRRRRAAAAAAVGWAMAATVGWVVAACFIDRWLALPSSARLIALLGAATAPVAILVGPVLRLVRRRVDPAVVAAAIERGQPAFAHQLVTAASGDGSAELRSAVAERVVATIAVVGVSPVDRRPVRLAWGTAVLGLLAAAGLCGWPWLDLPRLAERLARPTADLPAVTRVRLEVAPPPPRLVEGSPLLVSATADRLTASDRVALHVCRDGQTWAERPMLPDDGAYAVTLAGVDRPLRYFVTAGDAEGSTETIRPVPVPGVVALRVRYEAAGRPPLTVESADGVIDAPAGTPATVDVVATVPLESAAMTVGGEAVPLSATADPRVWRGRLTVTADGAVVIRLASTDGVSGRGPGSAVVRVSATGDAGVGRFAEQQQAYRAAVGRSAPATRGAGG